MTQKPEARGSSMRSLTPGTTYERSKGEEKKKKEKEKSKGPQGLKWNVVYSMWED